MNDATDDDALIALTSKISRERGFGATSYKDTCMRRRISVRMRATGAGSFAAYSDILDSDPAEYERLIAELTVNVTKLYRNPEVWEAVRQKVLPALWQSATTRVACWVAGCSSGEEAYTISAIWHEYATSIGETERVSRVRITASDIDRDVLAASDRGVYGDDAFSEAPSEWRERWFTPAESAGQYSAKPELRSLIRFEKRDLLQENPPPGAMQMITCRNVIIYFDRASQEQLMKRFHDALAPGGFLVLGKVETLLGASRGLFEAIDTRQRIFRRPL